MSFIERAMKNKSNKTNLTDTEMAQTLEVITERGLLSKARWVSMPRPLVEYARMDIDSRGPESPVFENVKLYSSKLRMPWTITDEYLEGSAKYKQSTFELIHKMMAVQMANDLEDLAVNGDEESTDALLRSQNGWLALSTKVRVRTWKRTNVTEQDIKNTLKKQLRGVRADKINAFVSHDDQLDMIMALPATPNTGIPDPLMGIRVGPVQVEPSAYIQAGHALIANPDNLVFGVVRGATCWADAQPELKQTKFELDIRAAFAIQNPDLSFHVVVDPIKPKITAWFKKVFRR